jgi:hypothetical protein
MVVIVRPDSTEITWKTCLDVVGKKAWVKCIINNQMIAYDKGALYYFAAGETF